MNRTTVRSTMTAAGALLTAIMMTGCATAQPPATQSSPPQPAATSSTSPSSSSPEPMADAADPSTWTVSDTGVGPIALGADFDEALAAVPDWAVTEGCDWTASWNAPEKAVTGYFAEDSEARDGVTTIDVAALTDTVEPSDAPRTAEGVGVGSTRDDVEQAYPDAVEQTATIGGASLLRVQGTIFFTFQPGSETVDAITVTSLDEPPYEACA